ncbi:MAG: NAD-dependent epimerase/dehydratase family protein [Candidatus Hydrogenedentota bacterium]|nr:MAG: NAD-dependent epimerase/dehydratase family protein [Candidatus Hydrogenedentota bacterium]
MVPREKVLITGATGFVGSAVLRRLLNRGFPVRALVRRTSVRDNIRGLAVETVEGDLRDRPSLEKALAGCSLLFHVAADYRFYAPDPTEIFCTNVDGTRNLMEAALKAGIRRIVYTSSVAVLGHPRDGSEATEETPATLEAMIGHYKRSKFLAEEIVQRMVESKNLPAVIVNPTAPVGPRDIKPTPTGRMILEASRGRIPAVIDTGLNIVSVDDVAEGHLLALEKGVLGRRYILGGENMTLKTIISIAAEHAGVPPPRFTLPRAPLIPIAFLLESIALLTGKPPRFTRDELEMARHPMYFSSRRAREELGYRPGPAADAIRRAVDWFRSSGYR